MPIPFLVLGAIGAGVLGAGAHLSAQETNEKAQQKAKEAKNLYDKAKCSLETAQNNTKKELLKLGYEKKEILETSMNKFLFYYDKVKHVQFNESLGIDELSKLTIDKQDTIELVKMKEIYSSSVVDGATGAAAGTIIALAASGSLSVVTGGLATAGTALLAGELGVAAGIAGSALSFGAAMTPLAAVAAPVVLFTGISASLKADENLSKANTMYAEAEAACEKMEVSKTLCNGITRKSEMFYNLLVDLNKMFSECADLLEVVIKNKEENSKDKKLNANDFSKEDLELMAISGALAKAVKIAIDTPIVSNNGKVSRESETVYNDSMKVIPNFKSKVEIVKNADYNIKPKKKKIGTKFKQSSTENINKDLSKKDSTALMIARNILAFILAYIIATFTLGLILPTGNSNFILLSMKEESFFAIWLLVFSIVVMLVGKFKTNKVDKIFGLFSAIAISILYVEYIRILQLMYTNNILISLITLFISVGIIAFLIATKSKWKFISYMKKILLCIAIWPVLFFIYNSFVTTKGYSPDKCLIGTTVVVVIFSFYIMIKKHKNYLSQ